MYPRTSIDNSRRVRQLAHIVQGQIALSYGKQMAKHMTSIVGPWVAGIYDSDKSVLRAANESFMKVFSSEEKRKSVWRLYQSSIMEYHRDIINKETATTLSDERTTSQDDASAKYARVAGSSIMVVTNLLGPLSRMILCETHKLNDAIESSSDAEDEKFKTSLHDFLHEEKVWRLGSHTDPYVRRAVYRLLTIALLKQQSMIDFSTISTHILTSGLHSTQTGSALEFVKTLSTLTARLPEIWTRYYNGSGKKSAGNRLCYFLKKGSQGAPPEFWDYISNLLLKIPSAIVANTTSGEASDIADDEDQLKFPVLESLHEGFSRRDEPILNRGKAWHAFLDIFELLHGTLEKPQQSNLCNTYLVPILEQYVRPVHEQTHWSISGPSPEAVYSHTWDLLFGADELLHKKLKILSEKIIGDIQTSQPEQAKEYAKSQDAVAAETRKWYQLQRCFLEKYHDVTLRNVVTQNVEAEMKCAISILENRNGKPYGAAVSLEAVILSLPNICFEVETIQEPLLHFVNTVIPSLMMSPSAKYLVQILNHIEGNLDVTDAINKCVQRMGEAEPSAAKFDTLEQWLSSHRLTRDDRLISVVMSSLRHALEFDDDQSWNLVMATMGNPAASPDLTDKILADMTKGLSISEESKSSLHGLDAALKKNGSKVKDFAISSKGSGLISTLLLLIESSDEAVSQQAKGLNSMLEAALKADGSNTQVMQPFLDLINQGLGQPSRSTLPYGVSSLKI